MLKLTYYNKKLPPSEDILDVKDYYIHRGKSLPTWFQRLTQYYHGCKDYYEYVQKYWNIVINGDNIPGPTVKKCPGIRNYFTNTVSMKIPGDIIIETFLNPENGMSGAKWYTMDNNIQIDWHDEQQYVGLRNDDYNIIKISFPFSLSTNKTTTAIHVAPTFYNKLPGGIEIVPGILKFENYRCQETNFFLMIPKGNEKYIIKKDTVLVDFVFPEKIVEFKEPSDKQWHRVIKKTGMLQQKFKVKRETSYFFK